MTRPSGLGRGLSSLIPPAPPSADPDATYQHVAVDLIRPNSYQPRADFDDEAHEALAASVKELGVLQPLLVRRDGDGFELIAGERRWRAAQAAGLAEVPVIIREADNMASLEQALVENLHREDLNALEEAAAYQQLIDDFDMTQQQVAKRVGRSRSAVANTLRLLGLPPSLQAKVSTGALSPGHARALLALDDPEAQQAMAARIETERLTVRDVEQAIAGASDSRSSTGSSTRSSRRPGATKEPALLELEHLLAERLDTSVSVSMGSKRGKITIDYADLDDLERIYRLII